MKRSWFSICPLFRRRSEWPLPLQTELKPGWSSWMFWTKRAGDAVVDLGKPLGHATKILPDSVRPSDTQSLRFFDRTSRFKPSGHRPIDERPAP
jgi:hypothetical protein